MCDGVCILRVHKAFMVGKHAYFCYANIGANIQMARLVQATPTFH